MTTAREPRPAPPAARALPLVIVIPGFVPDSCLSLNGRRKAHWRLVYRATAESATQLALAAMAHGLQELPRWERVTVTVDLVFSTKRRRDVDNWSAACKGYLDELVALGVIPDDDSEHLVALTVRPSYEKGMSRTTITVEEVLR